MGDVVEIIENDILERLLLVVLLVNTIDVM